MSHNKEIMEMIKKGGADFPGTFWPVLGGCGSAVLAAAFADVGIGLLGVSENTFVFFTSDNGPQMDSWPDSGCTPFRGGKAWAWEGGVRVPGIAYLKGMIKPRESAGLFDLMDLFNTSVHLAAADEMIPADRYIDGIGQASFLIAGNGKTKREQVYVWVQTSLAAMRMREYRVHVALTREHSTFMEIDYATAEKVGLAPLAVQPLHRPERTDAGRPPHEPLAGLHGGGSQSARRNL
jgi:arylsulfatase A-like enzyme